MFTRPYHSSRQLKYKSTATSVCVDHSSVVHDAERQSRRCLAGFCFLILGPRYSCVNSKLKMYDNWKTNRLQRRCVLITVLSFMVPNANHVGVWPRVFDFLN